MPSGVSHAAPDGGGFGAAAVKSMLAKFGMRAMMLSFEPLYRRSSRSDESSTSRMLGDCANRRNRYRAGMIYRLDLSVASPLNESLP
jgi:hypothetical protein